MQFFSRMNPLGAIRDLRLFLHGRERHEIVFLLLAIAITGLVLAGFYYDSDVEKPYQPKITYFEQYRLDRSDAEIVAQQKIDQAKKELAAAEEAKRRAEIQASFKRLDDRLKKMGL